MIILAVLVIHMHGYELDRRIARTLAHTVKGTVHEKIPVSLLRISKHHLAVRISHLEIVVSVITYRDISVEILIEDLEYVSQIILMCKTVSIHHGHGIRLALIRKPAQVEELFV